MHTQALRSWHFHADEIGDRPRRSAEPDLVIDRGLGFLIQHYPPISRVGSTGTTKRSTPPRFDCNRIQRVSINEKQPCCWRLSTTGLCDRSNSLLRSLVLLGCRFSTNASD